ncbi:hypothetical protein [Lentzea albidocapillata]|uniref:Uncharacterized protein n=1 Tax=Lentzea albidocapillata TaxID=40571 RepID=A0A1W2FQI0_9PSEU|nr:hypothetical protein [Lentzea albidocapillata]SMD24195.1 hypothetical protein SAMN05660733_07667 [Lentzea albidocapillata]
MPHDRYGETDDNENQAVTADRPQQTVHRLPHACDQGWLDRNADHPRPCLTCRPHLAPHRRRADLGIPAARPAGDHQAGIKAVRAALIARPQQTTEATT